MFALWSVTQDYSLRQAEVDLQVWALAQKPGLMFRCCDSAVFSNLSFKMSEFHPRFLSSVSPEPRRKIKITLINL